MIDHKPFIRNFSIQSRTWSDHTVDQVVTEVDQEGSGMMMTGLPSNAFFSILYRTMGTLHTNKDIENRISTKERR